MFRGSGAGGVRKGSEIKPPTKNFDTNGKELLLPSINEDKEELFDDLHNANDMDDFDLMGDDMNTGFGLGGQFGLGGKKEKKNSDSLLGEFGTFGTIAGNHPLFKGNKNVTWQVKQKKNTFIVGWHVNIWKTDLTKSCLPPDTPASFFYEVTLDDPTEEEKNAVLSDMIAKEFISGGGGASSSAGFVKDGGVASAPNPKKSAQKEPKKKVASGDAGGASGGAGDKNFFVPPKMAKKRTIEDEKERLRELYKDPAWQKRVSRTKEQAMTLHENVGWSSIVRRQQV